MYYLFVRLSVKSYTIWLPFFSFDFQIFEWKGETRELFYPERIDLVCYFFYNFVQSIHAHACYLQCKNAKFIIIKLCHLLNQTTIHTCGCYLLLYIVINCNKVK